jgi:hypothetical protein
MARPDHDAPHNPKVPPRFDNSDTEEPQSDPRSVKPAMPTGDARSGHHGGETGTNVETDQKNRGDVERTKPKPPM